MPQYPVRLATAALVLALGATPPGVHAQMQGMHAHNPNAALHLQMTPARLATPADSVRADSIVSILRAALEQYRDVRRAEADGYRIFLPKVPQPIYHFTSWRRSLLSVFRFDPSQPATLLYRPLPDGGWELAGAMYNAPGRISLTALDARVPFGVARWHRHVNWCLPPLAHRERWKEARDGRPVFGPLSSIATREACKAAGGVFHSSVFGWMVHVDPYATSPAAVWGENH